MLNIYFLYIYFFHHVTNSLQISAYLLSLNKGEVAQHLGSNILIKYFFMTHPDFPGIISEPQRVTEGPLVFGLLNEDRIW